VKRKENAMTIIKQTLIALGLSAAGTLSMIAGATEVVPINYINSFDVHANRVVMTAENASWNVSHGCELYVESAAEVKVRPAHKTHAMPHRMNRVGVWDSLVITVDGKKHVCQIEDIQKVAPTYAAN